MANEHDTKLIEALKSLVAMAKANWPRNQDVTISLPAGAPAQGSVRVPVYLLDKLLKDFANG